MICYYFGAPGAGKTSLACREILRYYKRGLWTFANFGCKCADKDEDDFDLATIGQWTFPKHSFIAIDESGIEHNSRSWKSFKFAAIKWYKKHRHYLSDDGVISLFSQSWDDTDKILRDMAVQYYYIKKFGSFTLKRRMFKEITIDKMTGQPRDDCKFVSMWYLLFKPIYYVSFLIPGIGHLFRLIFPNFKEIELVFRPIYYKYFDSYECDDLPCPFDLEEMAEARRQRAQVVNVKSISNRIQGILRTCFSTCADRLRGIFKRG